MQNYYLIGIFYKNYDVGILMTTVRQFINSSISYLVSYLTLLIAFDRFLAVFSPTKYHNVAVARKRRITVICLITVGILSTVVHSWASFARWEMIEIEIEVETEVETGTEIEVETETEIQIINGTKWIGANATILFFQLAPRQLTSHVQKMFDFQIFYNGLFNIMYPMILVILTISVILNLLRTRAAVARGMRREISARRQSRSHHDRCLL